MRWRSSRCSDERRPCGVGDLRFVLEFVDGCKDGAVEFVDGLAALDAVDDVLAEAGLAAHADVVAPFVLAVAPMRDAQHRQLAQPVGQRSS